MIMKIKIKACHQFLYLDNLGTYLLLKGRG